jgi:hypothetical protein
MKMTARNPTIDPISVDVSNVLAVRARNETGTTRINVVCRDAGSHPVLPKDSATEVNPPTSAIWALDAWESSTAIVPAKARTARTAVVCRLPMLPG